MNSKELLKTIGQNINHIRKEKGVKGETLGKELGVTKAAVSNLENGLVDFKISTLIHIANVLNADISTLLELNNENAKEIELSDCRAQVYKQIRIIDMLVSRIEYMNEQIECMKMKKAG